MTPDPGPAWASRVIANIYPAVIEPDGRHEVIVETRDHDARWTAYDAAEVERILSVYRDREAAGYPHVVDMSPVGFSQIADTSQGVVDVTISW